MLKVNIINFKTKGSTITYLFALAMANKSITIGNINLFEKLNVNQLDLLKKYLQFEKLLTI